VRIAAVPNLVWTACVIIAAGLIVELIVASGLMSPFVLAKPSDALASIVMLYQNENLPALFGRTFAMTFVATSIAALIGIPLGWVVARSLILQKAFESWIGAAFSAPIVLLYPLFLVLFGRGYTTLVVMGAIVGVVPIALKTMEGYRQVPRVLLNVADSYNMSDTQKLYFVRIPSALPSIFSGIRIALIYVLINIIAIDFLVSIGGLGFLVAEMYDRFNIPAMYGGIFFVIVTSIIYFTILERCESWLSWRK
jgi:NitT/TauT family transport system permease protein